MTPTRYEVEYAWADDVPKALPELIAGRTFADREEAVTAARGWVDDGLLDGLPTGLAWPHRIAAVYVRRPVLTFESVEEPA
jgi:hypothetical protein